MPRELTQNEAATAAVLTKRKECIRSVFVWQCCCPECSRSLVREYADNQNLLPLAVQHEVEDAESRAAKEGRRA